MEDLVPFGSRVYFAMLGILLFARGMDFLSTWVATPNLILEGNPVVKKLGWKWAMPLNVIFCLGLAAWPLPGLILSTTSVLVAARNFQNAWLMRLMGETAYRHWYADRLRETGLPLYLFCLLSQTLLIAAVGAALIYFSPALLAPVAVGMGIIVYAVAVTFYTALSVWRIRRALV